MFSPIYGKTCRVEKEIERAERARACRGFKVGGVGPSVDPVQTLVVLNHLLEPTEPISRQPAMVQTCHTRAR